MVEGHHCVPPWAVGVRSALRPAAIRCRLAPSARSVRIRSITSAGTSGGRPRSSRRRARLGGSSALGEQSLELVDRDQLGSPWHLDRLDVGQDAPVEGRAAETERLGRLAAGVGEPLDERRLASDHALRRPARLDPWRGRRAAASWQSGGVRDASPSGHRTRIMDDFAPMVHLCLALLSTVVVAVRLGSSSGVSARGGGRGCGLAGARAPSCGACAGGARRLRLEGSRRAFGRGRPSRRSEAGGCGRGSLGCPGCGGLRSRVFPTAPARG